jgi:transcriptional regulator with XRE-family HTH domain
MTPGDIIKRARTTKGLSQRQLATLSGVTPSFVTKIEAGDTLPGYERCMALAHVLDIAVDDLWAQAEQERLEASQQRLHTCGMAMRGAVRTRSWRQGSSDASSPPEMSVEELAQELANDPELEEIIRDLRRALANPIKRAWVVTRLKHGRTLNVANVKE